MKKYKTLQWLWQRISYWGDKLVTWIFYLLFGLFILAQRFIRWALTGLLASSKRFIRTLYSVYTGWRLQRRIRNDWNRRGQRDYYKELEEKEL